MKYDFETMVSRKGTGARKWEEMYEIKPDVSEDVVPLSVADMEFQTPPEIKEGLKKYIDETVLGYAQPYDKYFESVIDWFKRRHNFTIEKDWIVNTPGVVNALFGAVKAFTEPGDGVIVFKPVYYPFMDAILENKREIANAPLINNDGHYEIDYDKFEELARDPKNKLLIFCNPHNPIGRVWTKEELKRVSEIALENDLYVVSDEIWSDLVMPGYEQTMMASVSDEIADRLITSTAPSKSFNIAGLATSNIIVKNKEMRDRYLATLINMKSTTVNVLGYKACELAYNESEEWLNELLVVLDENQKLVHNFFKENYPEIKAPLMEGTYVQWVDFNALGMNPKELEEFVSQKAEFFVDQGYVFGEEGNGFLRINIAVPTEVLDRELKRLGRALDQLK